MGDREDSSIDAVIRKALKGQYHAALAMLRQAVESCPAEEWAAQGPGAPFWRIAYHTLYFTDLYLRRDETSFTPWEHHQTGIQYLDDVPGEPELDECLELAHRPPQTGVPYTKEQLLSYLRVCEDAVDCGVEELDVLAPESGFSWHRPARSKVEQNIAGIRHIQHHTAHLAGRVREASGTSVEWVGSRHTEPDPDRAETGS